MKARYLKEFVVDYGNRGTGQGAPQRGNPLPSPLGVIEVIHAASKGTDAAGRRVLVVAFAGDCLENQPPMKKMKSR